jgi:hypothetical protein
MRNAALVDHYRMWDMVTSSTNLAKIEREQETASDKGRTDSGREALVSSCLTNMYKYKNASQGCITLRIVQAASTGHSMRLSFRFEQRYRAVPHLRTRTAGRR